MVDVTPTSGMPQSLPVTTAVAERTDGDLPACRLRRVTAYIDENLRRELPDAEPLHDDVSAHHRHDADRVPPRRTTARPRV